MASIELIILILLNPLPRYASGPTTPRQSFQNSWTLRTRPVAAHDSPPRSRIVPKASKVERVYETQCVHTFTQSTAAP